MAKVLLYPRVLGTSISTTFGDRMQKMCVEHLGARASGVAGMDIEFGDKVEPQEVVAQLKAGPNTVNAGDVKEIVQEMGSAFRLLRQNKVSNMPTFAMCITYGEAAEVSTQYKNIKNAGVGAQAEIPLYVGQDFWYRLTGDKSFYHELIAVFVELFEEEDFSKLLKADIQRLSKEIEERYFTNGIFDLEKV